MSNAVRVRSIAELPVQRAAVLKTAAQRTARYFNTSNAFDMKLPEVPDRIFTAEAAAALASGTPTGLFACELSRELGIATPATAPLALARYARRVAEALETEFAESGVIVYVISGSGSTACGAESLGWNLDDVFVLPDGIRHRYVAGAADSVLWIVINEPQLAFEHLRGPAPGDAPTPLVHYPTDKIERQIELIYEVGRGRDIAGSALIFSPERQETIRNVLPTLTVAMNSLLPGVSQRTHRHNAMALALIINDDGGHSIIDGKRKDWAPWAMTIMPPTSVHSHHNEGSTCAMFLIIQDGRIYYYTRARGFSFIEA